MNPENTILKHASTVYMETAFTLLRKLGPFHLDLLM